MSNESAHGKPPSRAGALGRSTRTSNIELRSTLTVRGWMFDVRPVQGTPHPASPLRCQRPVQARVPEGRGDDDWRGAFLWRWPEFPPPRGRGGKNRKTGFMSAQLEARGNAHRAAPCRRSTPGGAPELGVRRPKRASRAFPRPCPHPAVKRPSASQGRGIEGEGCRAVSDSKPCIFNAQPAQVHGEHPFLGAHGDHEPEHRTSNLELRSTFRVRCWMFEHVLVHGELHGKVARFRTAAEGVTMTGRGGGAMPSPT
jgi:hypothetical protein